MANASEKSRLCWKHQLRMFWAAWGTLMDLTGRTYPRRARRVLADARRCERCHFPAIPSLIRPCDAEAKSHADLINRAFPDRSAGRWCATCKQYGTYHTDRHDNFLAAAQEPRTSRPQGKANG